MKKKTVKAARGGENTHLHIAEPQTSHQKSCTPGKNKATS